MTAGLASAYAYAALLLPLTQLVDRPVGSWSWAAPMACVLAAAVMAWAGRVSRYALSSLGAAMVAVAGWLLGQASLGPSTLLLGIVLGIGAGFVVPWPPDVRGGTQRVALAMGVAQVAIAMAVADGASTVNGALFAAALLLASARPARTARAGGWLRGAAALALTLVTACWVGANTLSASWFGRLVNHGARDRPLVALTFDDGPNIGSTLPVARILDRAGVKGTFFTVGKALDARPDISRALLADGQLLANHSYHHDAWRWLDPGYAELDRTQDAFRRRLSVCPTFFRPPHGQHTPFMTHQAHAHHMTAVGWDVSGGDWSTTDGTLVARRVLARVRPGSIILLHDGIDGNLRADRAVVLEALPLILKGLAARHLQPVRLDRLLQEPAYRGQC